MGQLEFGQEIELQTLLDSSGSLTIIDSLNLAGFETLRVYFLHSLQPESVRGSHAHLTLRQIIVPVAGNFTLHLTNSGDQKVIEARSPKLGYYVPPLTWREISHFSPDAVCLVLASASFSEEDYIRDRKTFDLLSS